MRFAPSTSQSPWMILDVLPAAVVRLDCEFRHTFVNRAAEEVLGGNCDELLGKRPWDSLPVLTGSPFEEQCRRAKAERVAVAFDQLLEPRHRWYAISAAPDSGGGIVVHFADITERRRPESDLRDSEERLSLFLESSPTAINISRGTDIIYANSSYLKLFGYKSLEDLKHRGPLEVFVPEWRPRILANIQARAQGLPTPDRYETECLRQDGTRFSTLLNVSKVTLADGPASVVFIMDITEIKRAERTRDFLAQAGGSQGGEPFFNSLARYLAESLQMDFVCIDRLKGDGLVAQTVSVWFDGHFQDNVEYALKDTPCGDVVGKRICCFREGVRHLFPGDAVLQEMVAESYAGTTLWSTNGKPIGLIAVIGRRPVENTQLLESTLEQVSMRAARELDRLDAEEVLRERETFLNETGRLARMGGWKLNLRTSELTWTQELFRIHEVDDSFVPSVERAFEFFTPECRPVARQVVERAIEQGEPFDLELELVTARNRRLWAQAVGGIQTRGDGTRMLSGTLQDISERKLAEEERTQLQMELAQARKMESIGRLAVGVAHDFNNLLTVINGYSALIVRRTPQEDPQFQDLNEIHNAGERAADLVGQLLAFSRKQALRSEILDLNAIVCGMKKMLCRLVREDIEVLFHVDPAAGPVLADKNQIERVIVNLVANARDAMPSGGTLTLETGQIHLQDQSLWCGQRIRPGAYTRLTVRDTGLGMDQSILDHLFEPFFTTKEQGKGTGLGLSSVQGIVAQSGGHVAVESELGKGTAFHVLLPITQSPALESNVAPACDAVGGHETILLVEDQEDVRRLAANALLSYGYKVLEAQDGSEALMLVDRHEGQIQLVVSDVVMPVLGGKELARRLGQRSHPIPVLLMSGYLGDEAGETTSPTDGLEFLPKPFTPEALAAEVRKRLGPPSSPAKVLSVDDETPIDDPLQLNRPREGFSADVADVPSDLRADLLAAVLDGDSARIDALIDKAVTHNPAAAAHLHELAREYEYDALSNALRLADSN